jgi:hypothetical protein
VVIADVLQRRRNGFDQVGLLDGRRHGVAAVMRALPDYPRRC